MSRIFSFASLLLVLSAAPVLAQDAMPDLVGDWNITFSEFHVKNTGYMNEGITGTMNIGKQRGRIIQGTIKWVTNGKPSSGSSRFSGVLAKDNKTVYIAGHNGSTRIMTIEGPDDLTMIVLNPVAKAPCAGYADFKRVK